MSAIIHDGVWPTMVTPFREDLSIDYSALEKLCEWYISQGVAGLFAACQSSEIFYMSLQERVAISEFVVRCVAGRVPVIVSGHVSDALEAQITEIKAMSQTGADAVVLITNHLAKSSESEDVWKRNAEYLFKSLPDTISLGLYECPYPYKRVLSPSLMQWCGKSGRFAFLKDTCGNVDAIKEKLRAVDGSQLKIFNASSATLLPTLRAGASGFSGVMANFHPGLYVWLCNHINHEKADCLGAFLSLMSAVEADYYPVNAKYRLQLEGLGFTLACRSRNVGSFPNEIWRLQVEQMRILETAFASVLSEPADMQ